MDLHEVWVELSSGTRVVVGKDLADIPAANQVAKRWRELAEQPGDALCESMPGSGVVIRPSAIIAIKAQLQPKAGKLEGVLKVDRAGIWL
jgi:hypothetical protein